MTPTSATAVLLLDQRCGTVCTLPKQLQQPDITFGQYKWSLKSGSNWPVSCTSHYLARPQYLVDDVQLLADNGRRLLRSANYRACVVPRTQNSFGDRAFSVAGPKIWNDLPPEL